MQYTAYYELIMCCVYICSVVIIDVIWKFKVTKYCRNNVQVPQEILTKCT